MAASSDHPFLPGHRPSSYQSSTSSGDVSQRHSATDESNSERQFRRVTVSPTRDDFSDTYETEGNSIDEVETALRTLDEEIDDTEQTVSSWSSSSAWRNPTTASYTGSPSFVSLPSVFSPQTTTISYDHRVRLSKITEHTEDSDASSVARPLSRGVASYPPRKDTPEAGTDKELPPPGRANQLIAVFESNRPASPSWDRTMTPRSPLMSSLASYSSRPSSPTKSGYTAPTSTLSSVFSPTYTTTRTPTSDTRATTSIEPTAQSASTAGTASFTTLRRPQGSPRSPLASVRNIVSLWKERSPAKTPTKSSPQTPRTLGLQATSATDDGLFAIRRRVSQHLNGQTRGDGTVSDAPDNESIRSRSSGGQVPGLHELSRYLSQTNNNSPLHIGTLYYLNVHSTPPFRWNRCQALLYPNMLLLSWIVPGAGRGVVQLDLMNCTGVESALSLSHPRAAEDVGAEAARAQDRVEHGDLMYTLVPFWMLYADGVERLACESLVERQRWVNRIWEAVNSRQPRAGTHLTPRSQSPTGSIRTIQSIDTVSSKVSVASSGAGSKSTVFVPPLHELPDIDDLYPVGSELEIATDRSESVYASLPGSDGSGARLALLPSLHNRTVDDTVISGHDYLYPGDPRVISSGSSLAPRRRVSSQLRRSGSMTDIGAEHRSSSSSEGGYHTPLSQPSSRESGFYTPSEARSDGTTYDLPTSSTYTPTAYSALYTSSFTPSRSLISLRQTESASMLGDSHDYSGSSSRSYTTSPTWTPSSWSSSLSRSQEVRRRGGSRSVTRSLVSSPSQSMGSESEKENINNLSDTTPTSREETTDTGYDVCPSSDLSDLTTRLSYTSDSSLLPSSSSSSTSGNGYISAPSPATTEYATAPRAPSSEASFQSLPTIPSLYTSVEEGSMSYHSADEPLTEYETPHYSPTELETIPSEHSTPTVPPSPLPPPPSKIISPENVPLPESSISSISTVTSFEEPSETTSSEPSFESSLPSSISLSVPLSSTSSSMPLDSITISSASSLTPEIESMRPSDWGAQSDVSYDSSILQPSPSVRSIALLDGPDTSFETSFLRPSQSLSSVDRFSTIPETSSPVSTIQPRVLLSSPVTSVSSMTESGTIGTLPISTETSLSRTPSILSTSTQTSLSTWVLDSVSVLSDQDDVASPPTLPSLLTTPSASSALPQESVQPPSTPSIDLSISTPAGYPSSPRSGLRTPTPQSVASGRYQPPVDQGIHQKLSDIASDLKTLAKEHKEDNEALANALDSIDGRLRELSFPERTMQQSRDIPSSSASLARTPSSVSNLSFLSSHHSEDWELYGPPASPPWVPAATFDSGSASATTAPYPDSSGSSSPPSPPSSFSPTSSSSSTVTIVPPRRSLTPVLSRIRDQLNTLATGQNDLLDQIRALQGPLDFAELLDRLGAVEDALRNVPRDIEPVSDRPDETVSTASSEVTIPIALHPRSGPSIAQQLDMLLSSIPGRDESEIPMPPRLEQFRYDPRGRPRSPVEPSALPPRPATEPIIILQPPVAQSSPVTAAQPDVQPVRPREFGPAPRPVFDVPPTTASPRPGTAPPGVSWYQPQPETRNIPRQTRQPPVAGYVPMPAVTQRPDDTAEMLLDILRENRLAQLASVDQQRELMRYMRGLNEWLARDVADRQNEIRGVNARLDQLRRDLDHVRRQQSLTETDESSSTEGSPVLPPVGPPVIPPFAADHLPLGFQPFPVVPGPTPFIPDMPRMPHAPVIPGEGFDGRAAMSMPHPVVPQEPSIPFIPPPMVSAPHDLIHRPSSPSSSSTSGGSSSTRSPTHQLLTPQIPMAVAPGPVAPAVAPGPPVVTITPSDYPRHATPGHLEGPVPVAVPPIPQQPTVIIQQPPQPLPGFGQPMPGPPAVLPQPTIVLRSRDSSRTRSSSSRSRSRSRGRRRTHSRTPPQIIHMPSRSHSRTPPVIIPTQQPPIIVPRSSSSHGHYTPPPILPPVIQQPATQPIVLPGDTYRRTPPLIIPSRDSPPPVVVQPPFTHRSRRSHSRSPPIVIQPSVAPSQYPTQPIHIQHSPSPTHRHRSPSLADRPHHRYRSPSDTSRRRPRRTYTPSDDGRRRRHDRGDSRSPSDGRRRRRRGASYSPSPERRRRRHRDDRSYSFSGSEDRSPRRRRTRRRSTSRQRTPSPVYHTVPPRTTVPTIIDPVYDGGHEGVIIPQQPHIPRPVDTHTLPEQSLYLPDQPQQLHPPVVAIPPSAPPDVVPRPEPHRYYPEPGTARILSRPATPVTVIDQPVPYPAQPGIPLQVHPPSQSVAAPLPVQPPLRPTPSVTPFHDAAIADAQREHLVRLGDLELRLQGAEDQAREAEDRREAEFRQHEEDRQQIFLDNEAKREQQAADLRSGLYQDLEGRIPPVVQEQDRVSVASLRAPHVAASQHAQDILETVTLEREQAARERDQAAAERERLRSEAEAERQRLVEVQEARIRELEDELSRVRGELEEIRQERITEAADLRERERIETIERDEGMRAQLGDITNLVNEQRQMCEQKKAVMDERWDEKRRRREEKENDWRELRAIVQRISDEMDIDRAKAEEARQATENRPGVERFIDELNKQGQEHKDLLNSLAENWRSEWLRQHEDTINAVRSMSQEQVHYNVEGYLDEFSKALASEVRMLLAEVGKLREERRTIQHELSFLFDVRSKYEPGGEYGGDWRPPAPATAPAAPPPPPGPAEVPQARTAWRSVHQRTSKKQKKKETAPAPAATPAADPRSQIRSWTTWQPDPNLAPTPPSIEPTLIVPERESPGLFGPRSPRDSKI